MGKFDNRDGFANPGHEWLTYETLFNNKVFRKSNQMRRMGTYRMPWDRVRIVLAGFLDEETLTRLREAFFPDLTENRQLSRCAFEPWRRDYRADIVDGLKRGRQTWAVMPYDYLDNIEDSRAIGTRTTRQDGIERLTYEWAMWQTASRSCVVALERVKKSGSWSLDPTLHEYYPEGAAVASTTEQVINWPFGRERDLDDIDGTRTQKVADLAGRFSVKVGVNFVGDMEQGGRTAGDKGVLEEDSILAAIRSEWISELDQLAGRDPARDPDLVVLPEVLTVTRRGADDLASGDGFQVRDLSRLKRDMVYFPALSIPFIGAGSDALDFDHLCPRWSAVDVNVWWRFWTSAFAERIGETKARLLVRYGLQASTPNAQNYLIEMTRDMQPTGRIVFRDLGDAFLHTDLVWMMFGPNAPVPAAGLKGQRFDAGAAATEGARRLLTFECSTLQNLSARETGGVVVGADAASYPRGTQFSWYAYTTLAKARTVASTSMVASNPEARAAGWQEQVFTDACWGMDHARAYVRQLNTDLQLGLKIDLTGAPDPKAFRALRDNEAGYASAGRLYEQFVAWEQREAAKVHNVLTSDQGRQALRRYHRAWLG
jgi:hypothetical protein